MAMLRWLLVSAVMAYGLVSCSDSATVPSPDLSSADPLVADIVQRSMQRVRNKRGATAAWNDLGRACYANGYVSEAEEAFTQSLRIDANQPKAV
ncbi:MAG: tetratricopeptide repeat protein, partial [Phycisphaerae bacterium]|nr:tetratricopeptide repeat protein [Phycisphaerae bacterium]